VIFEPAEQGVVGRATEQEPEISCANDMCVYGEEHITYAHIKVLGTTKCAGRAAVRTFHAEGALCVDPRADFLCYVSPYDDDL
jgi:hypothetical protein